MSGAQGPEVNIRADNSQFDSAMQASAAAARAAFSDMDSGGQRAAVQVTASLKQLQASLSAAQAQYSNLGGAAKAAVGEYVASLQAQIASMRETMAAGAASATTMAEGMGKIGPVAYEISSALGGMIARMQELRVAQGEVATAASVFTENVQNTGAVSTTTASQLAGIIDATMGFGAQAKSAAESAAAFSAVLGEVGGAVTTTASAGFSTMVAELAGVSANFKSAQESAAVFAAELGEVGTQVSTTASGGFSKLVAELAGVRGSFLSARDSAAVFDAELIKGNAALLGYTAELRAAADAENIVRASIVTSNVSLQEQIALLTGQNQSIKSAAASMAVFAANSSTAAEATGTFAQRLDTTRHGAEAASLSVSGITREIVVLAREAMTGQFSRVPGSVLVLARYFGTLSISVMGAVASFAALGFAAAELIGWLHRIHDARIAAEAGGSMFNPQIPQDQIDKFVQQARAIPDISEKAAGDVVRSFASMKGATAPLIQSLIDNLHVYATATGQDAASAAYKLAEAFQSPTAEGRKMLETLGPQGEAQLKAFDAALADNNPAAQRTAMLLGLQNAASGVRSNIKDLSGDMSNFRRTLMDMQNAETGGFGTSGAEAAKEDHLRTQKGLTDDLANAVKNMSNVQKDAGSTGDAWMSRQKMALDQQNEEITRNSQNYKAAQLEIAQNSAAFWEKEVKTGTLTDAQLLASKRAMYEAQERLEMEALRQGQSGTTSWLTSQTTALKEQNDNIIKLATSSKQAQLDMSKNSVEFWRKEVESGLLTDKQLIESKRELFTAETQLQMETLRANESAQRAGVAAAKKNLQEQLADLRAQQTAAKDDYTVVMNLEQQKLALIRGSLGERSILYQNELKVEAALENAHKADVLRLSQEDLTNQRQINQQTLDAKKEILEAQVIQHKITGVQEADILKQTYDKMAQLDIERVTQLRASLSQQTDAWRKMGDQILLLQARQVNQDAQFDKQRTEAAEKSATQTEKAFQQMWGSVSTAAKNSITNLITGTMTWQRAVGNVIKSVLGDFVNMCLQMLGRWAATMAAHEIINNVTLMREVATQQAAGASGWGSIIKWILQSVGITEAADATKQASEAATNIGLVQSNAAVAGAGAYASQASIPYVGPALGAAAMAEAISAVSALTPMAALAVGAWDVPHDMPANIHAGEMVVPANFASGIRSVMGGKGGNSQANSLTYSPTISNTGSGMSTNQMQALLRQQSGQMMQMLINLTRNGNLMLPGRA